MPRKRVRMGIEYARRATSARPTSWTTPRPLAGDVPFTVSSLVFYDAAGFCGEEALAVSDVGRVSPARLNPTRPVMIRAMETTLITDMCAPSHSMPIAAVVTAPTPAHTA